MVSLGVFCIVKPPESHEGSVPYSSPTQNEKPSWMVAGRGRMPWDVGVVHAPAGALIPSVFVGVSLPFIVMIGGGRGGGTSLMNLLLGLKAKVGVCICCRLGLCEP
jgi:hypothetical protein